MLEIFDIPQIITTYGYVGIFIIVFLESGIFFALPGDSLLFTAGLLAAGGILHIEILIPVIFVSTFLGGILGYYVGINLEKLRRFPFWRRILKEEHLTKTHEFFEKHGRFAVVFSRFVPIVRTFVPVVAGVVKMNYMSFIKYSLVSSFLWSTIMTFLGYFLGKSFPQIKDYMFFVIILVVLLSLVPVIWEVMKDRKNLKVFLLYIFLLSGIPLL